MQNRLQLAILGIVALAFAAIVSGQEPQNKPPTDNDPNKSAEKSQEKWSAVEQRLRQIEEETKKRIEQLEQQKKKVEAQAKVKLEQLDIEAKKLVQQAQTRAQEMIKKVKEATGNEKEPDKVTFTSPPRSVEEKLDKILDRLDKVEQRLDRLEKERRKGSSKSQ